MSASEIILSDLKENLLKKYENDKLFHSATEARINLFESFISALNLYQSPIKVRLRRVPIIEKSIQELHFLTTLDHDYPLSPSQADLILLNISDTNRRIIKESGQQMTDEIISQAIDDFNVLFDIYQTLQDTDKHLVHTDLIRLQKQLESWFKEYKPEINLKEQFVTAINNLSKRASDNIRHIIQTKNLSTADYCQFFPSITPKAKTADSTKPSVDATHDKEKPTPII